VAVLFLWPLSTTQASDFVGKDEGEGSLPASFDLGTGVVMTGPLEEIEQLVVHVQGAGTVEVIELDPDDPNAPVIALYHGNLQMTLDRSLLASTPVRIFMSPGDELLGGMAQAMLGHHSFPPFVLDQAVYELPIALLYPMEDLHTPRLGIEAIGIERERYRFVSRALGGSVTLLQHVNF
jgi:hypothetical protein